MTPAHIFTRVQLISLIHLVFWVLQLLVLARVIISWIRVDRHNPVVRFIYDTTEPMLRPFRSIVRARAGSLDFSPLILLLVLWIAERLVVSLVVGALP